MAPDWPIATIDELKAASPNAAATGPFGSSISSKLFKDRGIPVIRGSNLSEEVGVRLDERGLVFLSDEDADRFHRSSVKSGDLVFTCWGTINQVGLIDKRSTYPRYIVSNKQMKLTPHPQKVDGLFLYYLFSGPEMQQEILSQGIGSSVPGFNLGQLRNVKLRLPPLPEQRAIAHILGTLDDKIELNRRINETLEAIVRAIFKSWFVDFDPVRAKMEGHQPNGMDSETAALFCDAFEDSPLGSIPAGWTVAKVGDLVEFSYGKGLKEADRRYGPIPVFGSNGQVGWHDEALVDESGIVIGRKGNPGVVTWAPSAFFPIDTTFYVEPKSTHVSLHYLYYALSHLDLPSLSADSAVPGLNRNIAYMSDLGVPPLGVVEAFDHIRGPLAARAHANDEESRTLASIRDTLLPKLISGELRLNDAERLSEAV